MHTVFLVRHGQSDANAGLPTTNPQAAVLTQQGIKEAKCIAKFFNCYHPPKLIVTSPYLRARQTAEFTCKFFPLAPLEVWKIQEFTYLSSLHEERSTTENRRPKVDSYWKHPLPDFVDAPGSESFRSFINRVLAFMVRLEKIMQDPVAIFSHRQFISAVLWLTKRETIEITVEAMQHFKDFLDETPIPNGTIVQVKVRPDTFHWPYELITWHLKQPESALFE